MILLASKLPLLVTGRRTTPGVDGAVMPASSPLSFPEDICKSLVNIDRLSLREPALRITASLAKYPPLPLSVPLPLGGEPGPGLAMELCPLALLELFLLRPFRNLARWMLMNVGGPLGENMVDRAPPRLGADGPPKGVELMFMEDFST